jgi:MoaA/NifB/PqqE/SkfB family radical SAM enzyme
MIRFASASGYSLIEVFTNATLFDEALIEAFIDHRVAIATSFYSDDPETHDQITKHRGSFAHTVSNIKKFVSAGLQVRAGIIEMPENVGHAQRAKEFLEELGISDINIDPQRGVGRGENQLHSLDPFSELCGQCWKGKLCVTSLGRVYPCVFSRFADLGDVRRGITTILKEAPLSKFRATLSHRNNHLSGHHNSLLNQTSTVTASDIYVCSPDLCAPKSSDKCLPALSCSPDSRCHPSTGPCSPETRCNPTIRYPSAGSS